MPAAAVDRAEALRRAAEPGDSPARGNPRAPVVIVAWSEFQGPFCARVLPTLKELEAAYPDQLRFVWKHLPLPFHESSFLASEAALAAHEQGKFWEMHYRLFAQQHRLDPVAFEEHAKAIGLDVGKFEAALDGGKFRKRVEADVQLAREADIAGTPTFLINGEILRGAVPLVMFKQRVDVALAVAKGLPPPAVQPQVNRPGPEVLAALERHNMFWPPPAITLPDALLGDRVHGSFATGNAPVRGNIKGPVEVLYFTPLGAAKGRGLVQGLLASYGEHVRLVAKVIPTPAGRAPASPTLLAEAGLYAHSQGKFWQFHDALRPEPMDRAKIEEVARRVGLDVAELGAALDEGRFQAALAEEADARRAARVDELSFVVDGRRAEGTVALAQLVEAAIRRAGRKPPARAQGAVEVAIDPADPKYNQLRLNEHLSIRQIFSLEPRDDAWAGAVEKSLSPLIDRDLRTIEPKLASTTVDCRTTLCRLWWRAGKGNDAAIHAAVTYLYAGKGTGQRSEQYLPLRANLAKAADEGIAALRSRRSTLLYNHRTGRPVPKLAFPTERLPKE
jgi:protein-disulfide isomerase